MTPPDPLKQQAEGADGQATSAGKRRAAAGQSKKKKKRRKPKKKAKESEKQERTRGGPRVPSRAELALMQNESGRMLLTFLMILKELLRCVGGAGCTGRMSACTIELTSPLSPRLA